MTFIKKWSLEDISSGIKKFVNENGRLPTSSEVDRIDYLPSSRQIQRLFGGLPNLRKLIGYDDVYLAKGKHRSKIGYDSNKRSKISEDNLRDILYQKFHEPFVHLEKPIDPIRKLRADFYVFNPIENFAVDIFATETLHNLDTNIYIKLKKYSHLPLKMYFVLVSKQLTVGDISLFMRRKSDKFPKNIQLITLDDFIKMIQTIPAYQNPIVEK